MLLSDLSMSGRSGRKLLSTRTRKHDERKNVTSCVMALLLLILVVCCTLLGVAIQAVYGNKILETVKKVSEEVGGNLTQEKVTVRNLRKVAVPEKGVFTIEQEKAQAKAVSTQSLTQKETLVLTTSDGNTIRILLRPDWSPESVQYIRSLVEHASTTCEQCGLRFLEHGGRILQGGMFSKKNPLMPEMPKGRCPAGLETFVNDCEFTKSWDPDCGPCRGPIMQPGMVAWTNGETGPFFFVNMYPGKYQDFWGTQHTVWGQIVDPGSFGHTKKLTETLTAHVEPKRGLHVLDQPVIFVKMEIEVEQ